MTDKLTLADEKKTPWFRLAPMILLLGTIVVAIASLPATAQPIAPDATDATGPQIKYFDFFVMKGGPIAYGLILLSVVTIALTIEHFMSIRRVTIVPSDTADEARGLLSERKYLDAITYTAEDPSMMGYVLNTGLLEASNGYEAMERALEESLDERSAKLFRKIEYLNIIGIVAPMIGLFGTVTGMIFLFARIHAQGQIPAPRDVANDIAVALITTFWGLAVAIWALSFHAVFRNRIDVLTAECALAAERLLSVFKPGAAGHAEGEANRPGGAA